MATRRDFDVTYKVLVLGEASVGKTALIQSYTEKDRPFDPMLLPTIGIDFRTEFTTIDGLRIRTQIWDTAGQERFRTMNKMYFRGAKGTLLVYDVTNRSSFNQVRNWMQDLKQFDLDNEEVILLGNKIDLDHLREVPSHEGKTIARKYGIQFMETSAKTRENVTEAFQQLVYNMKDANDSTTQPRSERIGDEDWEKMHENNGIIQPTKEDVKKVDAASNSYSCCW
eukprot:gene19456-21379_t